ncbi:hypothetical protein RhiirA5_353291 [Rhizophagus irregularis]|uniref:Uncharacterized protein n=1 Tax=Rhizophagus irregularis TaxID=588596 RepID=A0A2I1EFK4_9GLOM|nr:hypothetical protein RhiirA5_353291 [Rhizophagus irregularis]PKY20919.1 hypothetical protein RhiirB3_408900 [Rhizophagus irregularis]
MEIIRVNSSYYSNAIYDYYNSGFNFGNTLYTSGQQIYFGNSGYYDDNINNVLSPYLGNNFVPEEIEVFKITTS